MNKHTVNKQAHTHTQPQAHKDKWENQSQKELKQHEVYT